MDGLRHALFEFDVAGLEPVVEKFE